MQVTPLNLPADMIERAQADWEKKRARQQRWVEKNPGRTHHGPNEPKYKDYRFVGWDGEAPRDAGYCLFGSSDGDELCSKDLQTSDFFDLLLGAKERDRHTIFVWFGGRYDWDEITRRSIPLKYLSRLKNAGTVYWHGYRLTEIPGKIYSVSKNGITAKLFEIHGWFHTPYAIALQNYQIASESDLKLIMEGKNDRPDFLWEKIEEIRTYMRMELKYYAPLMNRVRDIVLQAGFNPRGWYGPSALARELLTKNHVMKSMASCPKEVNRAACFGFIGGRFEEPRGGIIHDTTWTYDKNSAYMHAALDLPNLARGHWRHSTVGTYEPGKFGIYRIRYHDRSSFDPLRVYPLPRRLKNGNVCWPRRVESWYWSPEAALVAGDKAATFLEGWIFDEDDPTDRPFAFVKEVYRKRLVLQNLPNTNPSRIAEIAFKWALAAIYGQLARIVGWNKKRKLPPPTHQIEWAGYILSHCRADMYRLARQAGHFLVSIDTDSVTTLKELKGIELGRELGQWKVTKADSAVYFQNGVFYTMHDGEWSKGKTRGIAKRTKTPDLTPQMLIDAIKNDCAVKLTPKRKYITVREALNGQYNNIGEWLEHPGNTLVFGGGGKRYHNRKMCWKYCSGEVHAFIPKPVGLEDVFDIDSYPRRLPWQEKGNNDIYTETVWTNLDDDMEDEEWLAQLVRSHGEQESYELCSTVLRTVVR